MKQQHVGIRNSLHTWDDEQNDYDVGFVISYAEDIEEVGWKGIVKRIRDTVGDNPVYSKEIELRQTNTYSDPLTPQSPSILMS